MCHRGSSTTTNFATLREMLGIQCNWKLQWDV